LIEIIEVSMTKVLMRVLLAVGLIHANAPSCQAQERQKSASVEHVFTPAELQADFKVLRGALEESHAGLYWFVSKPVLDRRFEAVYASLNCGLTQRQFYTRLLPLVAGLQHGHTQITDSTRGVGYVLRELSAEGKFLPFALQLVGNKVYIRQNCSSDGTFSVGTEILSINQKPVSRIVAEMLPSISADGGSISFKRHQLESFKFHALLDLLYGHQDAFLIDSRTPDGKRLRNRKVLAETPQSIAQNYQKVAGRSIDFFAPALEFKMLNEPKSALLTIRSFYEGYGQPRFDFAQFFKETFAEVKKQGVQNLILDLRDNEGGNGDYPPLLYSYLCDKPFTLGGATILASNRSSFFRYASQLSDDLKQFQTNPEKFVSLSPTGEYVLKPISTLRRM
jgi:hypothetical protein